MNELIKSLKALVKQHKSTLIIIALAICLFISLLFLGSSIHNNRMQRRTDIANITALTDSMQFYKSKSGDLVAEKTLLMGDMDLLKIANKELADKIEDMKVNQPTQVVYVNTIVENEVHDTTWMVPSLDTTVVRNFDFSNQWRELCGTIKLENMNLSLNIDKDRVFVDYTLAIKDNMVYVKSENPYVKYNEIQGLTMPKTKKAWSIGVGPTVSFGYDFQHKTYAPFVGVSVGIYYNLIQF